MKDISIGLGDWKLPPIKHITRINYVKWAKFNKNIYLITPSSKLVLRVFYFFV